MKKKQQLRSCISHPSPTVTASRLLKQEQWIKKAISVGKREEQPNMDGNVLAKRIASHAVSEKATKLQFKPKKMFWGCSRGLCLPSRVRVQLSNNGRVRVGSVQHIYGSLRVRVRILGPVKTSSVVYSSLYLLVFVTKTQLLLFLSICYS